MFIFLEKNKVIYTFQFGFRQKHSVTPALIHLTELIRKELDDGNCSCGIFVDFQKTLNTVDHDLLLKKLEHYGIRGLPNKWLASCLSNRNQFVSINGSSSDLADTICEVLCCF